MSEVKTNAAKRLMLQKDLKKNAACHLLREMNGLPKERNVGF